MAVRVINILKDGTVVPDMSKVTVPEDIVKAVIAISKRKGDKENVK